ncbi:MAG: hypothetical protein U0167_09680 [bacterium]
MTTFPSNRLGCIVAVALAAAACATPATADMLGRARITVDASKPPAVELQESFDWSAQGGAPRPELAFFLARSIQVKSAKSQGAALALRSEGVAGAPMTKWIVKLPTPLAPGAARSIDLVASVAAGGAPGIRADAKGGCLLPGSGWFPAISIETDEMPPHVTEIRVPAGWVGVACGVQSTPGTPWAAAKSGRPYAAWGNYQVQKASEGGVEFVAYRRAGATGALPRLANLSKILSALTTGLADAPGTGPWKLIDVGGGTVGGGQRTLFWDESAAAIASKDVPSVVDRDLAGGLAAAYWNEAIRFFGPQAAFLSGALPRCVGDASALTLDASDDRWRSEARIVGDRRSIYLKARAKDRPLKGLVRQAPEAATVLDGRGALVAHMAADACQGTSPTSAWISFLRDFRKAHEGERAEWADMARALDKQFPNQHKFLTPFLETTNVPDFVLGAHGPSKRGALGERYSVQILNRGQAAAYAELACYTAKDRLLRSTRVFLEAGAKSTVLLGDARLIARLRLEPRGTTLQSSIDGEQADLGAPPPENVADFTPAFQFSVGDRAMHEVHGLDIQLDGITVRGFDGALQWWETYHGPSGAVMLGKGHVVIAPTGEFAAAFKKTMGKDTLEFDCTDFFLRFPLATWKQISPKLGAAVDSKTQADLSARRTFMFEHCFPTYFAEKDLAEVPPPGGALVIAGLAGGEWRGFVRQQRPDGKVFMRLWDHLRGTVLWEATL